MMFPYDKTVKIAGPNEYYDKTVKIVDHFELLPDLVVKVAGPYDPTYDITVRVVDPLELIYDLKIRVVNPADLPAEYRVSVPQPSHRQVPQPSHRQVPPAASGTAQPWQYLAIGLFFVIFFCGALATTMGGTAGNSQGGWIIVGVCFLIMILFAVAKRR